MKLKLKLILLVLLPLILLNSCGKSSSDNVTTSLSPHPVVPTDPVNPISNSQPITATELATKLKAKWSELKGMTYTKESSKNPTTGKSKIQKVRYLPQDVKMAYCFPDNKKEEIFSNYDPYQTGFELASVSKLFTTLWTLQAKKHNYVLIPDQFKTYFSYNLSNGNLYIKGAYDPFFGIDRLEDALNIIKGEIKRRGITQILPIQKITTYNFIQLPIYTNQTTYELNVSETSQALALSPTLAKQSLIKVATYLKKVGNDFFKYSNLELLSVENNRIELKDRNNHNDEFANFEINASSSYINITSFQRPLNHLLIFLNTFSHNLGSDIFYQLLGGTNFFVKFLTKYMPPQLEPIILHGKKDDNLQLGFDPDISFAFYNGSGLPYSQKVSEEISDIQIPNSVISKEIDAEEYVETQASNSKARNKATCELIFKTLEGLSRQSMHASTVVEVLPINGTGTLKHSVSKDIPKGTFIGKTGTLNNLMTLAGLIKTKSGDKPFFISFFRNNIDDNGVFRPDAFGGKAHTFIRSTVTTELIKILFEYYQSGGKFTPNNELLAQLNVNDFLARSFSNLSVFQ